MEYVEGEDLKSLVKSKGKLSEIEAVAIAKQVCEGLVEAHELGVVHRDLKPQNIMIDEKDRARIMDFGIARSVEAPGVTQTGMIIGTPDYISPEQAEGKEADHRSDIYALGVILFEMLTGSVPFQGDTALSVALKHKSQLPMDPRKLNPEVSESMSHLILVCMEKDKERRYQSSEALLDDLHNIEEGFPLGTKIRARRETFIGTLKRKKLFVPAFILALAIIALAAWQLIPKRDVVPLSLSGKPSLAVLYFENNTGDESLNHWKKGLSFSLISDLSQSKLLTVLPGDRLYQILNDLNQTETERYSSDVIKEVASQGKIENIVTGSLTKAGETFRINIMLQNVRTGETIGSERVEGEGEESLFSLVDELTLKIKAGLNLSAEDIANDVDMAVGKMTTSSPEAYKFYIEGFEYNNKGDFRQSLRYLDSAISVDPEFASAYALKAMVSNNMGYASDYNKNIQKAFELIDRVSERERYQIQGAFYKRSEETFDKAIEAYEKLLEIYPDDYSGSNLLGTTYRDIEEWGKAIQTLDVNVRKKHEMFFSYYAQSWAYMGEGLYEKAEDVLRLYINNLSDHYEMRFGLAINYLCQGKYELALEEAERAISLDPINHYNLALKGYILYLKGELTLAEREFDKALRIDEKVANLLAREGLWALYLSQGNFEKSIEQTKRAIDLAKQMDQSWWESKFHSNLAYLYLRTGNHGEALNECRMAWDSVGPMDRLVLQRLALYFKGFTYVEMGSLDLAQKTAEELKELIEKGLNRKAMRYYDHLMGTIELKRNNVSESLEYFQEALSLLSYQSQSDTLYFNAYALFYDSIAMAFYLAGDFEKAREKYETITALTVGRMYYGDVYAKSFYMLAKIHDQQGNTAMAIKNYEKFLDLWKDADPGIAEVEDAKSSLANLHLP
jgi:serine/threonine protein kinase/predicted Zn-dependent protease